MSSLERMIQDQNGYNFPYQEFGLMSPNKDEMMN